MLINHNPSVCKLQRLIEPTQAIERQTAPPLLIRNLLTRSIHLLLNLFKRHARLLRRNNNCAGSGNHYRRDYTNSLKDGYCKTLHFAPLEGWCVRLYAFTNRLCEAKIEPHLAGQYNNAYVYRTRCGLCDE